MEKLPLLTSLSPTLMMIGGFLVAWQFYIRRPDIPVALARDQGVLYRFLLNAWYFDGIYDVLFVRPAMWLGRRSGRAATATSSTASVLTAFPPACWT